MYSYHGVKINLSRFLLVQTEQADSRRRLEDLFQSLLHRTFVGEL